MPSLSVSCRNTLKASSWTMSREERRLVKERRKNRRWVHKRKRSSTWPQNNLRLTLVVLNLQIRR